MLYSGAFRKSINKVVKPRRFYGLPASAISLGTDPRKDRTVQLTPLRGVNIIHDPLLSKGEY
jgi:malate dehydrogenase (oxaloacetate-decarboxylating)(NADP+)